MNTTEDPSMKEDVLMWHAEMYKVVDGFEGEKDNLEIVQKFFLTDKETG